LSWTIATNAHFLEFTSPKKKKRKEINDLMGVFMGAHQQVKVARKTHREINVVNCGPVNCSSQFNENTLIFKII